MSFVTERSYVPSSAILEKFLVITVKEKPNRDEHFLLIGLEIVVLF